MRSAGKKAATVLEMIEPMCNLGVTTDDLDRICHDYIVNELQCIPAPLNYGGGGGQDRFSKIYLHLGKSRGLPWHPAQPKTPKTAMC